MNDDIIEKLRLTLRQAEAGEITSIAMVAGAADGGMFMHYSTPETFRTIGHIEKMKADLLAGIKLDR